MPKLTGKDTGKRLEIAMTIKKLREFSADEIADAFGVTRQALNYQYKKVKETDNA